MGIMDFFSKVILVIIGILWIQSGFAIESDTIHLGKNNSTAPFLFETAVTVTTKGISNLPNLTLGKPAAIFDLVLSKGNLSFEPQFRFALLTGKPWSFQFWWRYEVIQSGKFQLNVGARPSFNFKNKTLTINNITSEGIIVQRNLGGEFIPKYYISDKISLESRYLFLYGLDKNMTKYTNFISLRTCFSNIFIANNLSVKLAPQIYYLKMDNSDGFYFGSSLDLMKKNFPISLSSMFNKDIRSNLHGDHFLWNVSLIYTISKEFIENKIQGVL